MKFKSSKHPEITESAFHKNFESAQYPRNLTVTHDLEMYRIKHKETGKTYVLKRMRFYSEEEMKNFVFVLDKISELQHTNLLAIDSYFIEENFVKNVLVSYSVNIILEDFDYTLYDEIVLREKTKTEFSLEEIYEFTGQMVTVLEYLQRNGFSHGDIKPSNIFINKDNVYKLCFVTEQIHPLFDDINCNVFSSYKYFAPRVRINLTTSMINCTPSHNLVHDKYKSDVFSLGICIIQMICLRDILGLNGSASEKQRFDKIREYGQKFNIDFVSLLEAMLVDDEYKRPDFIALKPFLKDKMEKFYKMKAVYDALPKSTQDTIMLTPTPNNTEEIKEKPEVHIELKLFQDRCGDTLLFNMPSTSDVFEDSMVMLKEEEYYPESQQGETFIFSVDANRFKSDERKPEKIFDDNPLLQIHRKLSLQTPDDDPSTPQDAHDSSIIELAIDEMYIDNEEQLCNPMSPLIKKLVVKITGNKHRQDIATSLAEFISHQTLLNSLVITLPKMSLKDEGVHKIMESLLAPNELSILFLEFRKNHITDEGLHSISRVLAEKTKLQNLGLDLASNEISAYGCKYILEALEKLVSITSLALNIGSNEIQNQGLIEIGIGLTKLVSLENLVLFLYSNEIEDVDALDSFFNNILKLNNLKSITIDLSDNNINDDGGEYIVNFIQKIEVKSLQIELKKNCFSSTMQAKIHEALANKQKA